MAESRTAQAYETLKEKLLDGEFPPNSKLGIDQLAERLAVNPSAVREALSRLTSDRLVLSLPQRGFVVAPVSAADLIDLVAVRVDVEVRCLRRSIESGDLEWEGRLLGTWHRLSRTRRENDGALNPDWNRLHNQFHDQLVSACDSIWWLRLRDALFMQAERYRRMIPPRALVDRGVDAEHQEILDLTLARDVDGAADALKRHLELTGRHLLDFHSLDRREDSNELRSRPSDKIRA